MLKKDADMIARINKILNAFVQSDFNLGRLPKDLGEFEETVSLLSRLANTLKNINDGAGRIAAGDYSVDISPQNDRDGLGKSMHKIAATLREAANAAEMLAQGKTDIELKMEDKDSAGIMSSIARIVQQVKQSNTELQKSEARNRGIVETAVDAIITITADGIVQDFNPAAEALFDYRAEEVIGRNVKMLMPSSFAAKHDEYLANYVRTGIKKIIGIGREAVGQRKDGSQFPMHLSVGEVFIGGQRLFSGIVHDLSETKKAEEQLRESLENNREIVEQVTQICQAIADGNYSVKITPENDADILNLSLLKVVNTLKNIAAQANRIASGDYSANISPSGDQDELGIAMQKMTSTLRDITHENERQSWIKNGQNEINEKMRGDQDETALARNIITYLAKYLGAQVGALYLKEADSGELKLTAGYAFSKRKNLNERIKVGEGLVGQAAFEKELISVTNLPEDYTRINSAIGDAIPRNLVVSPLVFEGEVNGVIELGAFKEFSDTEMELLNVTRESIAVSFNTVKASDKVKELLEETKRQAENMEAQQEELRATNEELQEKTERLEAQSKELEAQQEELRATNEELQEKTDSLEEQSKELREMNKNLQAQKLEIENKGRALTLQAEELAISSKYKSEFLANMSHELRTPLNSMLLLSNNLAKNREGNLTPEQVKSASIVHKGGEDLLNLINEILDLSKIEAGMMELDLMPVAVQTLADSLERNFRHVTDEKKLDFKIDIAENLPVSITTDQKRLEQILKNLVSNAIKFTHKGSVSVNFSRPALGTNLSRSGLAAESTIVISVTDTGIGISPDKQKIIFEAFQQAEGGTARKYGGTGLGLSISRELASLLGGEIQVHSTAGQGASFILYLPLNSREKPKKNVPQKPVQTPSAPVFAPAPAPASVVSPVPPAPVSERRRAVDLTQTAAPGSASLDQDIQDDRDYLHVKRRRFTDKKILLLIEDDPQFAQILVDQCHAQDFSCLAAADGEEGLILADKYQPDGVILDLNLPGIDGWNVLGALKDNPRTRHIPVHIMSANDQDQNAENMGAIGFVTKPLNQQQLDEAFQKFQQYAEKKIKDLLIIEDDEGTRIGIRKLIGNGDVKITEARTGDEGFKALMSGNFDCVIMDLSLPGISGFDLLDKLLEESARIPPIIIYTGKEFSKKDHQRLLKYTDSIIIKGVNSEERLLDEASLFLHRIVEKLPREKQKIIHDLHDLETVFKDKKILIVDDDMRNIFAVTQLLEEKGLHVCEAEDGQSALNFLSREPDVDLVLMDIMMPGMDGYEAIRKIREQKQFKKLPIIAVTAKAMKDDRDKCIAAGASDYLTKPVEEQRLFSMLRIWLYK